MLHLCCSICLKFLVVGDFARFLILRHSYVDHPATPWMSVLHSQPQIQMRLLFSRVLHIATLLLPATYNRRPWWNIIRWLFMTSPGHNRCPKLTHHPKARFPRQQLKLLRGSIGNQWRVAFWTGTPLATKACTVCADTPDRILTKDTYGRTILQRVQKQHGIKYLSIPYCSRAMEWLDLRRTFKEVLSHFGILDQIDLDSLAFAWSYDRSIATRVYKPSQVFKHFSFVHLLDKHEKCMCNSFKRFESFLDPLTFVECDEFSHPVHHVRTTDLI